MDTNDLLHKLELHEAECAMRMKLIDERMALITQRLDQHDISFNKLERYLVMGFGGTASLIVLAIAILEFAR